MGTTMRQVISDAVTAGVTNAINNQAGTALTPQQLQQIVVIVTESNQYQSATTKIRAINQAHNDAADMLNTLLLMIQQNEGAQAQYNAIRQAITAVESSRDHVYTPGEEIAPPIGG